MIRRLKLLRDIVGCYKPHCPQVGVVLDRKVPKGKATNPRINTHTQRFVNSKQMGMRKGLVTRFVIHKKCIFPTLRNSIRVDGMSHLRESAKPTDERIG